MEYVGDEEDVAGADEGRYRVVVSHGARQAEARDEPDPGAHELDGGHEREGDDGGPEEAVAVRGSGDRIGGDAARIVVGCARDEAGAQDLEVANRGIVRVVRRGRLVAHLVRSC